MIRTGSDPLWRALQQLVLIVGPLLLRPLIEQQLGGSLFEPGNFERWMRANASGFSRTQINHLYAKRCTAHGL